MFSKMLHLIKIFYTIAVTTSIAKRTFSALTTLETFLRSTTTQPRLDRAVTLYVHKERTDEIEFIQLPC